MAHRESSSIETLINEDRYFCSNLLLTPSQEISSWTFENNLSMNSKLLKKSTIPLLPKIIRHHKSKIASESLINHTDIPDNNSQSKQTENSPFKSPNACGRTEKIQELRDKVKITQFTSLDDIAEKFNKAPNRNQFRPSAQSHKIKSLKKHKMRDLSTSDSHKINIELSNIDYPLMHASKGKKNKKILELAYLPRYYEKLFVTSNITQALKNQLNYIASERTGKLSEVKNNYNSERVNEFLDKIHLPSLKSKSTLCSIFPDKIALRNKYVLTPGMKHEYSN